MSWYVWVIAALLLYPFVYKEPPSTYFNGVGKAFVTILCWGAAIILAAGILIGKHA